MLTDIRALADQFLIAFPNINRDVLMSRLASFSMGCVVDMHDDVACDLATISNRILSMARGGVDGGV